MPTNKTSPSDLQMTKEDSHHPPSPPAWLQAELHEFTRRLREHAKTKQDGQKFEATLFGKLPAELRNQICESALEHDEPINFSIDRIRRILGLVETCRQLRSDTIKMAFTINTLELNIDKLILGTREEQAVFSKELAKAAPYAKYLTSPLNIVHTLSKDAYYPLVIEKAFSDAVDTVGKILGSSTTLQVDATIKILPPFLEEKFMQRQWWYENEYDRKFIEPIFIDDERMEMIEENEDLADVLHYNLLFSAERYQEAVDEAFGGSN